MPDILGNFEFSTTSSPTFIAPIKQKSNSPFFGILLNIIGIAAEVVIGIVSAGTSIPITIAANVAGVGLAFGASEAGSFVGSGNFLSPIESAVQLGASAFALLGTARAAINIGRLTKVGEEVNELTTLTRLEKSVIQNNLDNSTGGGLSAKKISLELVRAGRTEPEVLDDLEKLRNILINNGIKNKRFNQEVAFIRQETEIFDQLEGDLLARGVKLKNVFDILSANGVDVVGVSNINKLVRVIKRSKNSFEQFQKMQILSPLETTIERDISPTWASRFFTAQRADKGFTKLNKLLSLINPNTAIGEFLNKIGDPLKERVFGKLWEPLKKKTNQKLKQLIRQKIIKRDVPPKNGVYPCFGSSWINYLRATPLGNSQYKCFVIFRKWGWQPVLITPPLTLGFIENWSQSVSPGRIYHRFRREYGVEKGTYVDSKTWGSDLGAIFNVLGFIPDKYISLGTSLVGNIINAINVFSTNLWADFAKSPAKYLSQPVRDKVLEIGGGQFAKAIANQARGNRTAIRDYFTGKLQEQTESREGAFRKQRKEGKGKVDAIRGLGGLIK